MERIGRGGRWTAVLAAALMLAVPACSRGPAGPGLVLITLDCFRADLLAAYGGTPGVTPNLNRLAEEGVVFEHAWSPMATTHPSHASMLTGLYPRYHGVRWNGDRLRHDVPTAAELLARRGYATGAFVAYRAMLYRAGLGRGFATVSDAEAGEGPPMRSDAAVVDLALEWLGKRAPGAPFLLWVHLFGAHTPLEVTDYARQRLDGYAGPLLAAPDPDTLRALRSRILASEVERQALRTLYEGEAHAVDAQVGRLLAGLEARGLLGNSVVIAAGDHGQALGEGGYIGHGRRLDEVLLRVPLVARDFRAPAAPRQIAGGVGLVDLAPTLLTLSGRAAPAGIQGRSLGAAVLSGAEPANRVYLAETEFRPGRGAGRRTRPATAVLQWPWKLTREAGDTVWRLLDRAPWARPEKDPAAVRAARETLLPPLEAFLADEWYAGPEAELRQQDLDELKSLGYTQ